MKFVIKSLSFLPILLSTPEDTSIKFAPVILIASLILLGVRPPDKIQFFFKFNLLIRPQSKVNPLPPGIFDSIGGGESKR